MKVLMISTDKKIFDRNSAVNRRMVEYGGLVDELHIVVFAEKGFSEMKISDNVVVYTTDSRNRWFYIFDAIRTGKKIGKVDLITTQDPFETGIVGRCLARGVRLQVQIHTDFLSPYFVRGNMLNRVRVIISKFVLPKADSIRVVSERIKNSLIGSGIVKDWTKITVLPIFVDVKKHDSDFNLHKKYPQFDFIVLMASRLSEEKNISLALTAFGDVKEKYPKTGLVIIGEGEMRDILIKQAVSLHGNVIFEPWSDDLASYYKSADLFLNTSNYEGYGLTLVESAASGCPIVSTDVGVIGGVLNENNVLVCGVGDGECVAQKIIIAMENKAIRGRLAEDALKAVSKITVSKEDYLREYKRSWE